MRVIVCHHVTPAGIFHTMKKRIVGREIKKQMKTMLNQTNMKGKYNSIIDSMIKTL